MSPTRPDAAGRAVPTAFRGLRLLDGGGAMVERESLLAPTKELPPCGPNLEHDLAFFELEEAARGKPEQHIGDVVKLAEDPKWPTVVDMSQGLLQRSKDLRVAV